MNTVVPTRVIVRINVGEWRSCRKCLAWLMLATTLSLLGLTVVVLVVLGAARVGLIYR